MHADDYVKNAIKTESRDWNGIHTRTSTVNYMRLSHAAMGMVTEAAEFIDVLKKHAFYGKEIDATNLAEEIGDIFWYIAIACDELKVDPSKIMQTNIDKLKARYGEKFNTDGAINRDLNTERDILEEGYGSTRETSSL